MSSLFYVTPATTVNEALPLGNGRLGCLVFGGAPVERLVLNEETLWSGKKRNRINPACRSRIEEVRKLITDGNTVEAERLAQACVAATPPTQRRYKTMCDITLNFFHDGEISGYSRKLNLDTAVAETEYECGGVVYKREIFISHPADCIVIRLTAKNGKMNFVAGGKLKGGFEKVVSDKSGGAAFFGGEGIKFSCVMRVAECDGEVSSSGGDITVKNATRAVLLISAATDFKYKFPYRKACGIINNSLKCDSEYLLKEHIKDYAKLYGRVGLSFGGDERRDIPTDVRLSEFAKGKEDSGLISLYFDYGRYLLISSSRRGGLPANLQGIWNEEHTPCWDSKFTININLQMNYWHANICGLEECYEPFFALLRRVRKSGKKTAKRMYGCRGFVAHHNTDLTADTAPQDKVASATYWVTGGAWLALHIYDYYAFTGDKEFLRKNYRVLRDAVKFFKDFLIEDGEGYLVTCPSVSPENSYFDGNGNKVSLCSGPTSDTAILTALFKDFISAAAELGKDKKLSLEALKMLEKLPPYKIGSDGRLLEWREEFAEAEKGHRHLSHLIGLFPTNSITVEGAPNLAKAAEKSLNYRLSHGGGGTGWSCAWVVCLKARLKDGEGAYENLRKLISNSTLPNLTDCHPRPAGDIFQIDGNFGGACGIAEMLLQSYNNTLFILPALPKELPCGEFSGFTARGGAICGVKWKNGKAERISIYPTRTAEYTVVYNGKSVKHTFLYGERTVFDGNLDIVGF